jgi:uncharacterized protein (DUF924 family)
MIGPQDVTDFWLNEVGPARWYESDPDLDATIRERFGAAWEHARNGGFKEWNARASSILAYLVLLDQFPRNMFRNDGRAYSTDKMARAAAKVAIEKKKDMRVSEPERQFFYLPLMHSECLMDQERCVCLMKTRMPDTGGQQLIHARAHREVIRKFGRFPYRNTVLARKITPPEAAFLDRGGYTSAVEAAQA